MSLLSLLRPKTPRVDHPKSACSCKCCGSSAEFFGSADTAKSCEDHKRKVLPATGINVHYYRCGKCGFLFSDFMDTWTIDRARTEIYNDEYTSVDPDILEVRPRHNAKLLHSLFAKLGDSLSVLDYGAGDGALSRHLAGLGHRGIQSFDPVYATNPKPNSTFDFITAFEVIEHVPDPVATFREVSEFMHETSVFFFSTLLQPADMLNQGTRWWYLAPRNGHISLHTAASLKAAAHAVGWQLDSFDQLVHVAYARKPAWFPKLESFFKPISHASSPSNSSQSTSAMHAKHDLSKVTESRNCRHGKMTYLKKDQYVGKSLAEYHEFSEGEVDVFRQILRHGDTVVEAGANIGAHTVAIAKLVGDGGKVIAYEPQRFIHEVLMRNLEDNNLHNVSARHAAVGTQTGTIHVPPLDYAGFNNFGGISVGGNAGESVPVETIDDLRLDNLRLIKVDVEGMETEVLRGAVDTIWRSRPLLYVECDRAEKNRELIELIQSLSYRLWLHVPLLYNPNNFANNSNNVFGNVASFNFLCVPEETATSLPGLREITDPNERFLPGQA